MEDENYQTQEAIEAQALELFQSDIEEKSDEKPRWLVELEDALETTVQTTAGLILLKYIYSLSRFDKPLVTINPTTFEVNPVASVYNSAKRDFWLNVRSHMKPHRRALIENPEEKKDVG